MVLDKSVYKMGDSVAIPQVIYLNSFIAMANSISASKVYEEINVIMAAM